VKALDKTVELKFGVAEMIHTCLLGLDAWRALDIRVRFPPTTALTTPYVDVDTEPSLVEDPKFSPQVLPEIQDSIAANVAIPEKFLYTGPDGNIRLQPKTTFSPIHQGFRHVPADLAPGLDIALDKLLSAEKIRTASPSDVNTSGLVVVKKPNGEVRPCVDYRALNEQLAPDPSPMHDIDVLTRTAASAGTVFSVLDLRNAYGCLPVHPDDQRLLGFGTFHRGKRVKYVPVAYNFGVKILPAAFQRLMNSLFSDMDGVWTFLDDLVLASGSVKDHIQLVNRVISRLTQYNLPISVEKCKFGYGTVRVLGHLIASNRVMADPRKTEAISKWPTPTTQAEHAAFRGSVQYIRRFIRQCSDLTARADRALEQFGFRSPEYEAAIEALRQAATHTIIQHSLRPFGRLVLKTDASLLAIGAVLECDGFVIAVASRRLASFERNYLPWRIELLALLFGLASFATFLDGREFEVLVDNAALSKWSDSQNIPRVAKEHLEFIQRFSFSTAAIPGTENLLADAISRQGESTPTPSNPRLPAEISAAPLAPSTTMSIGVCVLSASAPAVPLETEEQRKSFVLEVHSQAHVGAEALYADLRFRRGYLWKGMRRDIKNWIADCVPCALHNQHARGYHPLQSATAQSVWTDVTMDLAMSLEPAGEWRYLLVAACMFTGFVLLRPLRSKEAVAITHELEWFFANFGTCVRICVDGGSEFRNNVVETFLQRHGVRIQYGAVGHHASQGLAEQSVKQVKLLLRKLMHGRSHEWPQWLATVQAAYNSRVSPIHNCSPAELFFGRSHVLRTAEERKLFLDAVHRGPTLTAEEVDLFVEHLEQRLALLPIMAGKLHHHRTRQVDRINRSRRLVPELPPGTLVRRKVPPLTNKNVAPFSDLLRVHRVVHGKYELQNLDGTILPGLVPREHLKEQVGSAPDDDPHYVLSHIVDHRDDPDGLRRYRVRWHGYDSHADTWEDASRFSSEKPIRKYEAALHQQSESKNPGTSAAMVNSGGRKSLRNKNKNKL